MDLPIAASSPGDCRSGASEAPSPTASAIAIRLVQAATSSRSTAWSAKALFRISSGAGMCDAADMLPAGAIQPSLSGDGLLPRHWRIASGRCTCASYPPTFCCSRAFISG